MDERFTRMQTSPRITHRVAASQNDSRVDLRSNVFLNASLNCGGATQAVRIRNISPQGALLEGDNLPIEKTRIELVRGRLRATGDVAWGIQGSCGVRFHSEIKVDEWSRRVEHQGQVRVDLTISHFRQGMRPFSSGANPPDSLELISRDLDEILETLVVLSASTSPHLDELLRIESIAQRLRALQSAAT